MKNMQRQNCQTKTLNPDRRIKQRENPENNIEKYKRKINYPGKPRLYLEISKWCYSHLPCAYLDAISEKKKKKAQIIQ